MSSRVYSGACTATRSTSGVIANDLPKEVHLHVSILRRSGVIKSNPRILRPESQWQRELPKGRAVDTFTLWQRNSQGHDEINVCLIDHDVAFGRLYLVWRLKL